MAQTFVADTPVLSAPEPVASVVASARSGAALRVLRRQGFWLEVQAGAARGWVRISAVKLAIPGAPPALDTGRTGANNIVAISSARGLSVRDLLEGRSDEQATERLAGWRQPPNLIALFAQEGVLAEALPAAPRAETAPSVPRPRLLRPPPEAAGASVDEEATGRAGVARILGAVPLQASPDLQRYVNLVGGLLGSRADARQNWRFGVLDTEAIHAFAAPGGFVLVTSGLLRQLASEDELAAVLAREIAHVVRQHHYQAIVRQRNATAATRSLQPGSGRGADDLTVLTRASGALYAKGLDRQTEFEADLMGARLMAQAGYDPTASLSVLEKLDGLTPGDPRIALLAVTHPAPKERMDALARAGIESLPVPVASAQARNARFTRTLRESLGK